MHAAHSAEQACRSKKQKESEQESKNDHEVSRCLKPFCGLWHQGLWKFADFTP